MEHTEQLNRVLEQLRQEPLKSFETLKETAGSAYPLLMELAEQGGVADFKLDDLRIALRCNLRRNLIYDSDEEWKEKRTPLIDAIIKAVNAGSDSRIWLRLLEDSLPGGEAERIISELQDEQIDRDLFPATEMEVEFIPAGKHMDWYSAMLDRSEQHKEQIYNRLAFFFLWYGEADSDEEKAKHYFREMQRQGIEWRNPYPGTFGPHGHDEMIRHLLTGGADADAEGDSEGSRDIAGFRILTEYAKKQLAQVAANGMRGGVERDEYDFATVWSAWLEDLCCRDLRESMRRFYNVMLANPSEKERDLFDDFLRDYRAALIQLMDGGGGQGAQPAEQDRGKGVVFLLALLLHYDNWLLRIIDLENDAGCTDAQRCACIEQWVNAIEPFCGGEFYFGDELLVLNSLQENLISYYEKQENRTDMMRVLEQQVYGPDTPVVLSGLGEEVGTAHYGQPYFTHNAIALLKLYMDAGEEAKAARLKRDIAQTEETLQPERWYGVFEDSRTMLKKKYEALLNGAQEWTSQEEDEEPEDQTEMEEQTEPERRGFKGLTIISGYIIAFRRTWEEQWVLDHTFRPAPPMLRGDFINYVYSPQDDRDWFGMTEERREALLNSYITT